MASNLPDKLVSVDDRTGTDSDGEKINFAKTYKD